MSSELKFDSAKALSYRGIEPNPEKTKSAPASSTGSVCALRRMSDSEIRLSFPAHDSRSRIITIRFSARSSFMPSGTDATTPTPSMPPFCTPCEPKARASDTHRDSR